MRIERRLVEDGRFLFRWRSLLPLLMLPLAVPVLRIGAELDTWLGDGLEDAWGYACMLLSVLGLGLRGMTVGFVPAGTSGRNTRRQVAEQLNTTGLYSVTRNPIYLGNFLMVAGLAAYTKVWWFALLCVLAYWLFIERVIAVEEDFLSAKFGSRYEAWASAAPIFFPRWRLWQRPAMGFSLRAVLARESNTLLTLAGAFLLLEFGMDIAFQQQPIEQWVLDDGLWLWWFAASAALFSIVTFLKKRTRLLRADGR